MKTGKSFTVDPRYITDDKGICSAVVLSLEDYEALMDIVEEYNDARAFNQAVKENDEFHELEAVIRELQPESNS